MTLTPGQLYHLRGHVRQVVYLSQHCGVAKVRDPETEREWEEPTACLSLRQLPTWLHTVARKRK